VGDPYRSWPLEIGLALVFFAMGVAVKDMPPPIWAPLLTLGFLALAYAYAQPMLQADQSTWGLVALVLLLLSWGTAMGISQLNEDRNYVYILAILYGDHDLGPYDLMLVNRWGQHFENVSIRITKAPLDLSNFRLKPAVHIGDIDGDGILLLDVLPLPLGRYQVEIFSRQVWLSEEIEIRLNENGSPRQSLILRKQGANKIILNMP
jgi:hypothetical protein